MHNLSLWWDISHVWPPLSPQAPPPPQPQTAFMGHPRQQTAVVLRGNEPLLFAQPLLLPLPGCPPPPPSIGGNFLGGDSGEPWRKATPLLCKIFPYLVFLNASISLLLTVLHVFFQYSVASRHLCLLQVVFACRGTPNARNDYLSSFALALRATYRPLFGIPHPIHLPEHHECGLIQ